MNLIRDLKELLLPRLCPVCGKLLMQSEDTLCAYCAIGLPRYRVTNIFEQPAAADAVGQSRHQESHNLPLLQSLLALSQTYHRH